MVSRCHFKCFPQSALENFLDYPTLNDKSFLFRRQHFLIFVLVKIFLLRFLFVSSLIMHFKCLFFFLSWTDGWLSTWSLSLNQHSMISRTIKILKSKRVYAHICIKLSFHMKLSTRLRKPDYYHLIIHIHCSRLFLNASSLQLLSEREMFIFQSKRLLSYCYFDQIN